MNETGRFAWITEGSAPNSEAMWDTEILRTDRFVALPSVGALVPGWSLVIPRRRMGNLAAATPGERLELLGIVDRIAGPLGKQGNTIYCFEHGARGTGSLTGCGVDQAHLHVVPLPFDLIQAAGRYRDGAIAWGEARISDSPLDDLPRTAEYVLLWRSSDHQTAVGQVRRPVSQWLRRVIAAELGIESQWNYRTHPQPNNVSETLFLLGGLRASLSV